MTPIGTPELVLLLVAKCARCSVAETFYLRGFFSSITPHVAATVIPPSVGVVGVPAGGLACDRYGKERRSNRDGRYAFRLSALARIRFRGASGAASRYRICRIDRAEHLRRSRALFSLEGWKCPSRP